MAIILTAAPGVLSVVESIAQETLPAGGAIVAGNVVTLNPDTGRWMLADADVMDHHAPLYIALKTVAAGVGLTAIKTGVVDGYDLDDLPYGAPVFLSAVAGNLETAILPRTEIQTVTLTNVPTGGTFTLTFRGETTGPIAFDAAFGDVATALEALPTIGAGGVTVAAGAAGGPFTVTFAGTLAGQSVPMLVGDNTLLTGAGVKPEVVVVEATSGISRIRLGYVIPAPHTTLGVAYDKLLFVDC